MLWVKYVSVLNMENQKIEKSSTNYKKNEIVFKRFSAKNILFKVRPFLFLS